MTALRCADQVENIGAKGGGVRFRDCLALKGRSRGRIWLGVQKADSGGNQILLRAYGPARSSSRLGMLHLQDFSFWNQDLSSVIFSVVVDVLIDSEASATSSILRSANSILNIIHKKILCLINEYNITNWD